jgi:hypothetical protein
MGTNQSLNKSKQSFVAPCIMTEDVHLSDEDFMKLIDRYGPVEVRDDGDKSIITQIDGPYTFAYANLGRTGEFLPGHGVRKLLPLQQ